jgi:hypothetical protein
LQHIQVTGVEQRGRAQHSQRHDRGLQQVQHGRPAREVGLHRRHEAVNAVGKGAGLYAQGGQRRRGLGCPALAETLPVGFNGFKARAGLVVPGHEERPVGVALAQEGEAVVKLPQFAGDGVPRAGADRERQPEGLHPHAASLVERRSAAIELPGHPQREPDQQQRQRDEGRRHQGQLGAQPPVRALGHGGECSPQVSVTLYCARVAVLVSLFAPPAESTPTQNRFGSETDINKLCLRQLESL